MDKDQKKDQKKDGQTIETDGLKEDPGVKGAAQPPMRRKRRRSRRNTSGTGFPIITDTA